MSIKVVTEIPKPIATVKSDKPVGYYRDLAHKDITDAYLRHIEKFEFVGYDTKPDYLAQVARDEAYKICEVVVYAPARKYVAKVLKKEFDTEDIRCVSTPYKSSDNIIKIYGITLDDGVKHVYCEIDYKRADAYKKKMVEPSRKRTQEHIEHEQRKAEREKWIKGQK